MAMRIPTKVDPCPIIDAVIGVSFEPDIVNDAVFGIVYNAVKDRYPNTQTLPILQIPEEIRHKDPNLDSQPHYKITNDNFRVLIGPKGIAISSPKEYIGWKMFLEEADLLFSKIAKLSIVKQVTRVGLRYINFFDFDIYDNIKLKVLIGDSPLECNNVLIKSEIPCNDFTSVLQVTNKATAKIEGRNFSGSIIDIDTYTSQNLENFFPDYLSVIINGHDEEKKLFFSLLKTEFIETLNPTYAGE